jgi:cytochrome P450
MTPTREEPTTPCGPSDPDRHAEDAPDRIDLDAGGGLLRPIWAQSAREVVRRVVRREPTATGRAPMPAVGDPILGHLREGLGEPLTAFLRWREEVGDVARLRLGAVPVHLVAHPTHIKEILQERHREFTKPLAGRQNLSKLLGNGLLVSEGDFWLRQRRIAQPAFHKGRIDGFAARMVEAAEDLGDAWERRGDAAFDVHRDMMRVTLRIVQETLLGAAPAEDADAIGDAVSYLIAEVNRRFRRVLEPPQAWPTPTNRRFARHRAVLDQVVGAMIRERRAGAPSDDLLSMLLRARDDDTGATMDDAQLRDEVMTIFLAGHETTANALSWTFYLLGKHPEVARRLRAELEEVLDGRPPTGADYPALRYTRMVFQEAMRLYPPAWVIARAPRHDVEIGGYPMRAGQRIFLSPWVTHRHPALWRDPEGFDPERFRDPSAIDPYAYFPFGGGRRLCIGQGFAMMEGVLVLASLARRFHLELVPGQDVRPQALVTLRPSPGVPVRAKPLG